MKLQRSSHHQPACPYGAFRSPRNLHSFLVVLIRSKSSSAGCGCAGFKKVSPENGCPGRSCISARAYRSRHCIVAWACVDHEKISRAFSFIRCLPVFSHPSCAPSSAASFASSPCNNPRPSSAVCRHLELQLCSTQQV